VWPYIYIKGKGKGKCKGKGKGKCKGKGKARSGVSVVVKALRYKSEGTGIDSRCRRVFSVASDTSMCPGVDSASKKNLNTCSIYDSTNA
jgi:hypothetical protein